MTLDPHPFFDRPLLERMRAPALWFVVALAVFCAFAGERLKGPSPHNHFVYLADSYLHGTLELRGEPPHHNDWATVTEITLASGEELSGIWWDRSAREFLDLEGNRYRIDAHDMRGMRTSHRHYVSFPPMPAVLMMPGVAVLGFSFPDVLFTLLFAAMNVALVFTLLRRVQLGGRSRLQPLDVHWLTGLFAFGTNHLWCSVQGTVWFTALVIGVTFTLAYVHCAIDAKRPFWAGVFLACAFATRTPLLFSTVFFAAYFFFPQGRFREDFGARFWRDGIRFAIVPLIVGCLLMAANHARFGSLTEFGHTYLAYGQIDRIKHYGLFNVHFLTRNLLSMFVQLPQLLPREPYVVISNHGLALWVTSPALFWLMKAPAEHSPVDRLYRRACWVTVAAIALPHIFYQNTGWVQFGYRFSMDYLAYLTLLLALTLTRLGWGFRLATLIGVGVNVFGAMIFDRVPRHFGEWFLEP